MQERSTETAWPIYIVSLRRSAARRAQCAETMVRLGLRFEFFDAVEGATLPDEEIARVYDVEMNAQLYKHPLSRPEIGCWLSHYALWERISDGAAGGAFLLEDDFQAQPGLAEVMEAIERAGLENCMVKLFALRPVHGTEVGKLPDGHELVMPHHVPGLTLGYAVDRVAAGRLAAQAMPIGMPVDMDIKHWWRADVPVLVVQPPVLRVDMRTTGSTIEAARSQSRVDMRGREPGVLGRAWRNLRYQFAYNSGVLCHWEREREHARRLRNMLQNKR